MSNLTVLITKVFTRVLNNIQDVSVFFVPPCDNLSMSSENMEPSTSDNRYKRKRKKTFLMNARKYAKKGYFGRGSRLDEDTYQYFVRIMEAYKAGFESDEDKLNFANNVFEQTIDQEINCCCNQVGCRVVETLLPLANDEVLKRYIKTLGEDLRPLCSDRFATHVIEALVTVCANKHLKNEDKEDYCKHFVIKVSKFLINNLEDFIWDTYGNHVIRTCLENLGQVPKDDPKNTKNPPVKDEVEVKAEVPEEFLQIIIDCGERLLHWPQFNDLVHSEMTSGFLQVLLRTLKKVNKKLLKKYLERLLGDNFAPESKEPKDENLLPEVFLSKSVVMLLETAIQLAPSKIFTQIYAKCFVGRIAKLAITRNTNFAVQKLIQNCKDKVDFEAIFEELKYSFQAIIEAGHTGIILALGQGCKNFATKQGNFVQSLMKSLNCFEPEERHNHFIICLARFRDYDTCQSLPNDNLHKDKLNLHGTLLLQLLLEFNKPIKIVNSIVEMDTKDLKNLFSNTMGSHIVDSYVTSSFVGEKSREKLVRKMKGCYQELASTKYGSRSFEAIWRAAGSKHKFQIIEELAYKDAAWSNTEHGKIIASKINLQLFKRNKEEWKQSLNNTVDKTKELFADIVKE